MEENTKIAKLQKERSLTDENAIATSEWMREIAQRRAPLPSASFCAAVISIASFAALMASSNLIN